MAIFTILRLTWQYHPDIMTLMETLSTKGDAVKSITNRILNIRLPPKRSAFLWGPRKTGKSFWLRTALNQPHHLIDLLQSDVYADYVSRPSLLRERYADSRQLIVIDEVQMAPELLNEVHWLIENRGLSFLLTGSSARKLKRRHANMLGGRAWRYTMQPLTHQETTGFALESVMISGLLPSHFLSPDPIMDLRAYVGDYLKEEIASEAMVQSMPSFAEFLRVAALTSGELLNYTNVARETGVSAKIVRGYFQILEDTLLGFRLPPWRKAVNRRLIETEKFYLFDVGVSNFLARRTPRAGTSEFGKSFEQWLLMELKAYQAYRQPELELHYWRTSTGLEVDFILGKMDVAIEVKASTRIHEIDTRPLQVLSEEQAVGKRILVCRESEPRRMPNGIELLPWQTFLRELWADQLV